MANWVDETLAEGIEVKHGFAFKGEFFAEKGSRILITPGNFHEEGGFKYTPGKEKFYLGEFPSEYLCSKGDLIVAMTEQAAGLLGSTALVPKNDIFLHNQRIGLISFDKSKYDKLFLYYLFQTKWVRAQIALSASGTKVKHTSPKRIYDVKVQRPPLPVQQNIGQLLFHIDTKIEINNKINTDLESMAKVIYDYWFVQFDFPDENGKPYKSSGGKMIYNKELKREIPDGWKVDSLQNHLNFERGISYTSKSTSTGEGISMINLKSFNLDGTYREDGLKFFNGKVRENKIVSNNDLLIAITDVTRNAEIIGRGILVPDLDTDEITLSCDIAKVECKTSISKYYLKYLFNTNHYHNYIKHFASGTLVLHLDLNGINWYTDVIPPIALQEKFENLVLGFHRKIELARKENLQLTKLRDWLLPMLMNRQVTVTPSDEKKEIQPLFFDPFIEQQRKITAKKNAPKHAAIIALSIDAHDKQNKNLYRTKGEKTVEVVEKHLNLVLGREPKKMAAGPAAFQHLVNVVEPLGSNYKWFSTEEVDRKGIKSYKYLKGENFEPFLSKAVKDFEYMLPELLRVIELFASIKTTHEAEVYATTYSGWNNLIIRNEKITDETIVVEARENWHEKKLSIKRDEFFDAIKWLKKHNLIPKGNGKEVL